MYGNPNSNDQMRMLTATNCRLSMDEAVEEKETKEKSTAM